jgi:hypothetical protein
MRSGAIQNPIFTLIIFFGKKTFVTIPNYGQLTRGKLMINGGKSTMN